MCINTCQKRGDRPRAIPVSYPFRGHRPGWETRFGWGMKNIWRVVAPFYGQFSKCHFSFCGLDPGNLIFETVRTNKQHICF